MGDQTDKEILRLTIILTNSCNLDCSYCFVNKDSGVMSLETARQSVDLLMEKSGEVTDLKIDFFGGEPTMKFDLIREVVRYGRAEAKKRGKRIAFGLTTNGTLFTPEMADFCWEHGIGILFSWDGTRKRIEKVKGQAGYMSMVRSLNLLKRKGYNVVGRMTVDPENPDLVESARHMLEAGFSTIIFAAMSGAESDYVKIRQSFHDYADFFIDEIKAGRLVPDEKLINNIHMAMGLRMVAKNTCDLARNSLGVTHDGLVLPCHHEETWREGHVMGNVRDKEIDESMRKRFLDYKRSNLEGCSKCFARPRCNGSCPQMNYEENKDLHVPWKGSCDFIRARFLAVEKIMDELYRKGPDRHFLREMMKWRMDYYANELEVTITSMEIQKGTAPEKPRFISFEIDKDNPSEGEAIAGYLGSHKIQGILQPIPRCVLGNRSSEFREKYQVPAQKIFSFLDDPHMMAEEKDAMRKYLEFLREDLEPGCWSCVFRMRKECDYCYLGPVRKTARA